MEKVLYILFIAVLTLNGSLLHAAPIPMEHQPSSLKGRELVRSDDTYIFALFEEVKAKPLGLNFEDITYKVFSDGARSRAINSFNVAAKNKIVSKEFWSQYDGNHFDYDSEFEPKTLFNHNDDNIDKERYEVRKAFAEHMVKKIGDYHFNRYIKYHPKIKHVVKKVENIDVTVELAKPSKPGGKPTKLKFRANPFKTEVMARLTSDYLDGEANYHVLNGSFVINLEKPSEIANFTLNYDLGSLKYDNIELARTYKLGMNKTVLKNVTASLELGGQESLDSRELEGPSSVFLSFSVPL